MLDVQRDGAGDAVNPCQVCNATGTAPATIARTFGTLNYPAVPAHRCGHCGGTGYYKDDEPDDEAVTP